MGQKKKTVLYCLECGKRYDTTRPDISKFDKKSCRQKHWRRLEQERKKELEQSLNSNELALIEKIAGSDKRLAYVLEYVESVCGIQALKELLKDKVFS